MTAIHDHHRKMRSQGGDDSPENILPVGFEFHNMIHAHPALAYEHGLLVHSYDDPAEVPVDMDGFLAALGHTPVGTGPEGGKKPCPRCHGEGTVVEKVKDPALEPSPERPKVTFSVRVPKDERENGYEVLDSLISGSTDLLADAGLLRDRNKGAAYYTLVYVLAFFQQNFKADRDV